MITGSGFGLQGYPVRCLFSIPFRGLNEDGLPMFMNENKEITVSDINFQESNDIITVEVLSDKETEASVSVINRTDSRTECRKLIRLNKG